MPCQISTKNKGFGMIPEPTKLQANDFILTIEFTDGQIRQIDVRTFLGGGIKSEEVKKSEAVFKTAYIEDGMSITWSNGFSLDPDAVYEDGVAVNSLPATGSVRDKVIAALGEVLQI